MVPLDDRRRWYRYHQLFADVLRAHLLDEQPERVPELHRRASAWYERNAQPSVRPTATWANSGLSAELLARFIHGASTRPPGEFSERVWDEMRPNCTAELGRIGRL